MAIGRHITIKEAKVYRQDEDKTAVHYTSLEGDDATAFVATNIWLELLGHHAGNIHEALQEFVDQTHNVRLESSVA